MQSNAVHMLAQEVARLILAGELSAGPVQLEYISAWQKAGLKHHSQRQEAFAQQSGQDSALLHIQVDSCSGNLNKEKDDKDKEKEEKEDEEDEDTFKWTAAVAISTFSSFVPPPQRRHNGR